MKYTDEQIDAFLKANNIEFLQYQKELFKMMINARPEDELAIVWPARSGWRYFLDTLKKFKEVYEGGKE